MCIYVCVHNLLVLAELVALHVLYNANLADFNCILKYVGFSFKHYNVIELKYPNKDIQIIFILYVYQIVTEA